MNNPQYQPKVYYQMTTTNKSFLNMHYFLKSIGIKNNKFMLVLYDKDLAGIDPFDRRLNSFMKQKVLRECMVNYWYFIRECVRIPDSGSTGGGVKYELHRGNMAYNFCSLLNLNTFLELPRQQFKSISIIVRYLYLLNFGTTNSEMAFLNKKMDDSKLNLARLKEIRAALPSYLQMDAAYANGKKGKVSNTVETVQHPTNNNKIRTVPSARNKAAAASLLRGRTLSLLWADEYAFIPFNDIIYTNTVPAFKTAAMNAKRNGAPYGITVSTTPGFLTTDEGIEAFKMKETATPFSEMWYDMTYQQIQEFVGANTTSDFVYIRYTYQQLGRDETWFTELCKTLRLDWPTIRREILLEWADSSSNSPFRQEDLEIVSQLVRQPIQQIVFLNKYIFNIYQQIEMRNGIPRHPPLIGVDVSGGYNRDSSAITCVDSYSTQVFADLNCNYISTVDLAKVIYELVTKYLPNAVVNVERNGGYGASVLAKLIGTKIKRNLYYEIKDKVIEERNEGNRIVKRTQKTKVYGLDSTKSVRELLIQILRERMDYHKDKFISPIIYNELKGMEVKKNGRIEHSTNTHDDQVFSYLMALYIWYEGKDLMERFGIEKTTIKTDENLDEEVYGFDEKYGSIIEEIELLENTEINETIKQLETAKGILYSQWLDAEIEKDKQAMDNILSTKLGRQAYAQKFNMNPNELEHAMYTVPQSVFTNFNSID